MRHIYQTITIGGQLFIKAFASLCVWYSLSNPEDVCEHSKEHSHISHIFTRIQRILIATYISTSDKYLRLVAFCASQTQAYNNARFASMYSLWVSLCLFICIYTPIFVASICHKCTWLLCPLSYLFMQIPYTIFSLDSLNQDVCSFTQK